MINVLHLYYDLLNLYGENANSRSIVYNLKLNNIKVKCDLKSINDKIDFDDYDIIYIGSGSEDNIKLALGDLINRKEDLLKYIESDKYLFLTGNSMDMFGKYIEENDEKIDCLNIFDYHTKFTDSSTFKNASADRIVGEVIADTSLIKYKVIGFQNRCDLNINIKNSLFKVNTKYSNDTKSKNEGFVYKNVYATHLIGPLFIRNPYLLDYFLSKICKDKKLKFKYQDKTSIEAYKKYLSNFS